MILSKDFGKDTLIFTVRNEMPSISLLQKGSLNNQISCYSFVKNTATRPLRCKRILLPELVNGELHYITT